MIWSLGMCDILKELLKMCNPGIGIHGDVQIFGAVLDLFWKIIDCFNSNSVVNCC